jgi:DNA-binding LacI/PurR family transcriptional regulator
MTVSIRDVAKTAGVSSCTVSKVLNKVPSRIAPATRDHVLQVAWNMGYQPNRFARGLGAKRTETIGLMVSGLQNPIFVEIAEAAEQVMMDAGYQVVLDSAPARHGTFVSHGKLRGWPVDGVLMWAPPHIEVTKYLGASASNLPVVYLGYPRTDGSDAVYFDLQGGGRQIGDHLADRGYESVLYVSHGWHEERHAGMMETCRAHGISVETVNLPDFQETRAAGFAIGQEIAARPADQRPRAVVCHNDVVAVGLFRALRRAGLRVPEDIAVVGFDGIEEGQYLDTPLTTVVTPADTLCRVAANLLLARMTGVPGTPPPGQQIAVPSRLSVGGTS